MTVSKPLLAKVAAALTVLSAVLALGATPALAAAPVLGEVTATNISSSSATLRATVNPGGPPTSYYFEYGTTTEYGGKTRLQSAGAGSEPGNVLAYLEGLQPETVYHVRLVAGNAEGTSRSPVDFTFTTFPVAPLGLPDNRSYEIVSPLNNGDATVLFGGPTRAAADGSAVEYKGSAPPSGGDEEAGITVNVRAAASNVYLAKRAPAGGWSATDIQPPGLKTAGYAAFTSDLSVAVLGTEEPLFEGAPGAREEQAIYSRNTADGAFGVVAAGARYEGGTSDGSHVLVEAAAGGLYDSSGGHLYPVSVLPGSEPSNVDITAAFGSPAGDLERVVSEPDGSRIFWTDTTTDDLYVRENDTQPDASTLLVAEDAQFQTASSDGSKVFFTDEKQLTNGSTAAVGAPDLYRYDLEDGALTDLSIAGGAEHADVVGVLGASEDGSYVYFAAAGKLTGDAAPQECLPEEAQEVQLGLDTKCNVYVVHEGETPKLVTVVAEPDGKNPTNKAVVIQYLEVGYFGDWDPNVGERSAHVTPDGRHLVFESVEDLTGFHSGGGREIYMYDVGAGVSCVSCNPSGAPTQHGQWFEDAHAELPPSLNSTYALRDVSADGNRVFFVSSEALTSQTTNEGGGESFFQQGKGTPNVYEWELEGSDESCPEKTSPRPDRGCIFLLSQGASSEISFFIDASESGDDVFFATRAQLVPQDHGEVIEVYDAHVCSSTAPCPPETTTACTGAGCQGVPAAPPIFATPSSVTFNGIGNFPPPSPVVVKKATKKKTVKCGKGKKLSKGRCVKPKPKVRGRGRSKQKG